MDPDSPVKPELDRHQVTGLLLCGGRSQRMGRSKATLPLGESDLLGRTIGILEGYCQRLLLATGTKPMYAERGHGVVLDRAPGLGPLGGLESGLAKAQTPWVLVVACDLPRLAPLVIDGLMQAANNAPDTQVVVWNCAGRIQPLCCLVRASCVAAVTAALDRGERRVVSFWEGPAADGTPRVLELAASPAIEAALVNVNTPAEWDAVLTQETSK